MSSWPRFAMRCRLFRCFAVIGALMLGWTCANAQVRMSPIPVDKQTDAQKAAIAAYLADRGSDPQGPYTAMLRSPDLMNRMRTLSDYIRFKSTLPAQLLELAVLTVARQWTIQYEWAGNSAAAIKAGLKPEIVQAIAEGRRPPGMTEDEEIIYDLCTELQRNQSVSDVTYNRAVTKFGEQTVVETVATVGYYTTVGMILNTARIPAPGNTPAPLTPFPATK